MITKAHVTIHPYALITLENERRLRSQAEFLQLNFYGQMYDFTNFGRLSEFAPYYFQACIHF